MFDVIVPVFKTRPEYIRKALESLQKQQNQNFQAWIVDGTPEDHERYPLIQEVYQDFQLDNFHYLRQTGKGVSQARNQAVAEGKAPFIAFLDSDDYWYSERIDWLSQDLPSRDEREVLWWGVMNCDKTLVGLSGESYSTPRVAGFLDEGEWERFTENWELGHDHFFAAIRPIMTSACVVRRNRFEEIGGFQSHLFFGEDTDCWMRIVGNPFTDADEDLYRLSYEPDLMGYYLCHDEQTTAGGIQTSANENNLETDYNLIQKILAAKEEQYKPYHVDPEAITDRDGFLARYADSWENNRKHWHWLLTPDGWGNKPVFSTSEL